MSNSAQLFKEADAKYGNRLSEFSETEKMLLGLPYLASCPSMTRDRLKARKVLNEYNKTSANFALLEADGDLPEGESAVDTPERRRLLAKLFGVDESKMKGVEIEPPFNVDYGTNIKLEGSFYANFNAVILDCAEVRIGHGVLFGPSVSIYCGTHTVELPERLAGLERGLPVSIGRDTWIGGGVIIMAGVNIGKGCTVGAGSIVTRDIPDFSVAVGSPAKVVKTLQGKDRGGIEDK